jgi:pSer/pThr/pTyr-binding forkhead associated (FHA) protein
MDQELKLPIGRRLSLAIIDGNDAGSVHRIDKPRIVIGRTGADVNVDDGEASRNHAAIEIRDNVFILEDLGSTNGTFVNGDRISAPVELTNQGEFQIGATTLMLIVTDDA